jgi:hypothetical protein
MRWFVLKLTLTLALSLFRVLGLGCGQALGCFHVSDEVHGFSCV